MCLKKTMGVILAVIMIALCLVPSIGAFAAEDQDLILTVQYRYDSGRLLLGGPSSDIDSNSFAIPGATMKLYYVASLGSDGRYYPTGPFASFPVDLNQTDSDGMVNAALALSGLIISSQIKPDYTRVTSANGIVSFPGNGTSLKKGLYLLTGDRIRYKGMIYNIRPTLYAMPYKNSDGSLIYNIVVNPKIEVSSYEIDEYIDIEVIKTWDDKGFEKERPSSVTAELYMDGNLYETALLNKDNAWSHTWAQLEADHTWSVVEKIPANYCYSVSRNENTYFLKNTYTVVPPVETTTAIDEPESTTKTDVPTTKPGEDTSTTVPGEPTTKPGTEPTTKPGTVPTTKPGGGTTNPNVPSTGNNVPTTRPGSPGGNTPSEPDIPNTGLLRWPVTVFSILGLLFIIIGWALIRKSSYEKFISTL